MTRSNTLDAVVRDLEAREAVGVDTYGCTVDRVDLGRRDWMRHAYHEALDLALYLRRAQDEEAKDDHAVGDRSNDGVGRVDGVGGRLAVGSTLTVDVPRQLLAGGATMALYVAMASLADEDGVVSASVRQIAGMVEMSSTTVAKLIGTLIRERYLQRLDQDVPNGRARYRLV